MNKAFAVGRFDLDIALRDASLDEMNRRGVHMPEHMFDPATEL